MTVKPSPPAVPRQDEAVDRDVRAQGRDRMADQRDLRAGRRDKQARAESDDADSGFAARFLSAVDRDNAAGDRADALEDRIASRLDRETARDAANDSSDTGGTNLLQHPRFQQALEDRGVIGQAQGLLMADMGLTAEEAFNVLRVEAMSRDLRLVDLAAEIADRPGPRLGGVR